jgi:hypothetical protein
MGKKTAKKRIGKTTRAKRILDVKPGTYADGMPLHELQYLECKLILRPNHFTSREREMKDAGLDRCRFLLAGIVAAIKAA